MDSFFRRNGRSPDSNTESAPNSDSFSLRRISNPMDDALPEGWSIRISKSRNKPYYYHEPSKKAQWDRPKSPARNQSPHTAHVSKRSASEQRALKRSRVESTNTTHQYGSDRLQSDSNARRMHLEAFIRRSMKAGVTPISSIRSTSRMFLSSSTASNARNQAPVFQPWKHQVQCVADIVSAVQSQSGSDASSTFLCQHSTGSGKSISIASLAHQLLYVRDEADNGFHTVFILVDRIQLSDQLSETVCGYLHRNGFFHVSTADSVQHLASLLHPDAASLEKKGRKDRRDVTSSASKSVSVLPSQQVIITTIHKFSLLMEDKVLTTRLFHHHGKKGTIQRKSEPRSAPGASETTNGIGSRTRVGKRRHVTGEKPGGEKSEELNVDTEGEEPMAESSTQTTSKSQLDGEDHGKEHDTRAVPRRTRIALIADEAHRSHNSSKRSSLTDIFERMGTHREDLTYVGFSATPSAAALALFGSRRCSVRDGFSHRLGPFHAFPLSRAIETGLVLDISANYRAVRCEVETNMPRTVMKTLLDGHVAFGAMREALLSDGVLRGKLRILVEHFQAVRRLYPFAKCMIVARNRRQVLAYYRLLINLQTETSTTSPLVAKWKPYAAFSGVVVDEKLQLVQDGAHSHGRGEKIVQITESTLNGTTLLSEADVLIVCDKLDTGFNEPKLVAMYVDRPLSGAKTVQLMSRLNRQFAGKREVFVLDFVNHPYQTLHQLSVFWNEVSIPANNERHTQRNESPCFAGVIDIHTSAATLLQLLFTDVVVMDGAARAILQQHLTTNIDIFQQIRYATELYLDACARVGQKHVALPIRTIRDLKCELDTLASSGCSSSDTDDKFSSEKVLSVTAPHADIQSSQVQTTLKRIKTNVCTDVVVYSGSINPAMFLRSIEMLSCFLVPTDAAEFCMERILLPLHSSSFIQSASSLVCLYVFASVSFAIRLRNTANVSLQLAQRIERVSRKMHQQEVHEEKTEMLMQLRLLRKKVVEDLTPRTKSK